MGWTYFTTWLSAGARIARSQREELLDAIEERMQAVGDPVFEWASEDASIRESALASHLVSYKIDGTTYSAVAIHELIIALADFYLKDSETDPLDTFWGDDLLSQALEDRSVDSDDWDDIVGSNFDVAEYWNVCRRMVQLLKVVTLAQLGNSTSYDREFTVTGPVHGSMTRPTWSTFKTGFFAVDPTTTTGGMAFAAELNIHALTASDPAVDSEFWGRSIRRSAQVTVPDIACFGSYALWIPRRLSVGAYTYASDPATLIDASRVYSFAGVDYTDATLLTDMEDEDGAQTMKKFIFPDALSATGTIDVAVKILAAEDAAAINSFSGDGDWTHAAVLPLSDYGRPFAAEPTFDQT